MLIRRKILLFTLSVITLSSFLMTAVWFRAGSRMAERYLRDISSAVMKSADEAFDYLLKDMTNLASVITLNEKNIVQPASALRTKTIRSGGQWNLEYLKNSRMIRDFISELSGHKQYVAAITVAVGEDCIFSTTDLFLDEGAICERILKEDEEKLKTSLNILEPYAVEYKSGTMKSGYVLPAVRGILDADRTIIGYCILYVNYDVIESIFSANLPKGSFLKIVNENGNGIYSSGGREPHGEGFVRSGYTNPEAGWEFSIAVPAGLYTDELNRIMGETALIFLAIFVFTFFSLIIIIRKMTDEISMLKNAMLAMPQGDMSARYEVRSSDEIGQMGNVFNRMADRLQALMTEIREQEKKKRLVEISFLEAQINPHFISNVLNNVIWMARIQHADNMIPLVQSLNSLLQNVMHQEKDMIPLSDELEYVENYIRIVEYSGSNDFEVEREIAPGTENQLVLRFILQPVVENAIRHGLKKHLCDEGRICISSENRNGELILTVEDNGEGMTEEKINELMSGNVSRKNHFNGIGIPNVRERIRLFFGDPYGLEYESEAGKYTKAIIRLPVIEEGSEWQN